MLKHVRSKHTENSNDVIKRIKSSSDVINQKTKLKKRKLIESKIVKPSTELLHFNDWQSSPKSPKKEKSEIVLDASHGGHVCQYCSFKCRFKRSLAKHVQVKHPGGKKEELPAADENQTMKPNLNNIKMMNLKKVKDDSKETESKNLTKNQFCFNCKFKTCQRKYLIRHFREKHPQKFKLLMKKLQKLNSSGNQAKVSNQQRKQDGVGKEDYKEDCQRIDAIVDNKNAQLKKYSCPECHFKSRFKVNVSRHLGTRHPSASVQVLVLQGQSEVMNDKADLNGKERKKKLSSICEPTAKSELKMKKISTTKTKKKGTIEKEDISSQKVSMSYD